MGSVDGNGGEGLICILRYPDHQENYVCTYDMPLKTHAYA